MFSILNWIIIMYKEIIDIIYRKNNFIKLKNLSKLTN